MKISISDAIRLLFWGALTLLEGFIFWHLASFVMAIGIQEAFPILLLLALLFLGLRVIWRNFIEHSPDMLCRQCRTWVIPRMDFRTKTEGYCPCCGALMWQRRPNEDGGGPWLRLLVLPYKAWQKWMAASLPAIGAKTTYCPDCKLMVAPMREDEQRADYCSICGVVLRANQTPFQIAT